MSVPAELTESVMAALEGRPGVITLTEMREASVTPPGDVVMADVLRETADEILQEMRDLGVNDRGTISVVHPDLVLSHTEAQVQELLPGSPSDAIVWEEVRRRTSEDASMSITYLAFMVCAMLIAGIGIMSDSPILIVAAMIVGPDFGPTAATAVGLATGRRAVAVRAFSTLLIGFVVGILCTMLFTWALIAVGIFSRDMVLAPRPQTEFIYEPGWLSLIVALIAGMVGMLSLTTAKSGALIGVFVSVTTIPAAANAAVALVFGLWNEAAGSVAQLLINIIGIQVAAGLTLLLQRRLQPRRMSERLSSQPNERSA